MADVFLSYARADAAIAGRIARELGTAGWSVWYDQELPAHRAYSDVIASELESAAAVLVLWSKASAESQWVRSEANRARELRKLVQARVGDGRLPMPFDQIQCADLTKWRGGSTHLGWSQVERSIRSLAGGESGQTAPEARADRRKVLLGGGAAVALIAGSAVIWTRGNRDSAPPEVALLMQKGVDALQSDDSAIIAQSIPLLTEATDAAPRYATAWGALALAYAVVRFNVPLAQRGAYAARCRSAARTALDLKPNEGRAIAALRLLDPVYGHWLGAEHDDRAALSRQPKLPILLAILADLLSDVGRWREALKYQLQMDRSRYLLPAADRDLVNILWATGNIQGADDAIAQAIERWPQHRSVWQTRTRFLMYTGRANEALALLQDSSARPEGLAQDYLDSMEATAEAITGRLNPAIAVERNLASLSTTPARALLIAQCCVALSATNVALAILEGYYFGTGEWARVAPLAGDEDRMTAPLFQPPMKPLWNDPRFIRLLSRTGLEEYWRRSKTRPDFRRNS